MTKCWGKGPVIYSTLNAARRYVYTLAKFGDTEDTKDSLRARHWRAVRKLGQCHKTIPMVLALKMEPSDGRTQ